MMNTFKRRAVCLLLTLSLLFTLSSVTAFASDKTDNGFYMGREILTRMPRGDALAGVYDSMRSGFLNMDEEIPYSISGAMTTEEIRAVYNMVIADTPECFWVNGIRVFNNVIKPDYNRTKEQAKEESELLAEKADELCRSLEGLSDYEIALALHDEIIKNTDYVFTPNDQNAYGALVEGEAVCAGYAAAYQYLLNKMNIPALCVTGTSADPQNGQYIPHAWTLAMLDGEYYYTDVTWDDQYTPGNNNSHIYHEFFNRTTAQFKDDHIADDIYQQYLPEFTADKDNYFVRNNSYLAEFDAFLIASKIAEGNKTASLCLTGEYTYNKFSSDYHNSLDKIVELLDIRSGSVSFSVLHMTNEVVLDISSDAELKLPSLNVTVKSSEAIPADCKLEISHGGKAIRTLAVPAGGAVQLDRLIPADYTLTVTGGEDTVSMEYTLTETADIELVLKEEPVIIFGDLDGDGRVTLKDSYMIKGIILCAFEVDADTFNAADINKDGRVDTRDSFLLKKIILTSGSTSLD